MHELPIAESALDIVLRHASDAGASRVTDVHFVLGELSGIESTCIEFYWDILAGDTPAEGARLHFRRAPLLFACRSCGVEFAPAGPDFACPACRGERVRVAGGDELRVEAIDVDGEQPSPAGTSPAIARRT